MRLRAGGAVRTGRAVDCTDLSLAPADALAAVRTDGPVATGESTPIAVHCPPPGPVHERVGHLGAGTSVAVRAALAAVARQRGLEAPQAEELAAVRAELAALDPPEPAVGPARERLAAVDERALAELREDVAARRGAVQARLELDAPVEPARDALSEAATALAEAQTDRVAAEQTLDRARDRARDARAARRERLRLQDRAGNLERAARAHLAGRLAEAFDAAVAAVPGAGRVPDGPTSFQGDEATAALAVARLAPLRAPVVLSGRWFSTAEAAARCLDAPVVRL